MATAARGISTHVIPWPDLQPSHANDTLSFLVRLHRGEDAAVALARKNKNLITPKNPQGMETLGTIKVSDFAGQSSTLRPALAHDAFWTINSTYIPEHYAKIPRCEETGLPKCRRRVLDLRWLNACYVDIDCYKVGLTPTAAYTGTLEYMQEHGLPLPTLALFSGRALWIFFELQTVVRAWPDECNLLYRINDNLCQRLKFLGADPQSKDAARVCRIPDSINSKSGERVYWREVPDSHPITLDKFAADLEVPPRKTVLTSADQRKPKYMRNPARVSGGYRRWITRRLDLLTWLESRHKITEGSRHWTLFYYAAISKSAGIPHNEIREEAADINARLFRPRYTDDKVSLSVAGGLSTRYNITDACLMRQLGIPLDAARKLKLSIAKPKRQPRSRDKQAEIAERRTKVMEFHSQGKSTREISQLLKNIGITASNFTISKDLQAIYKKAAPFLT